MQKNKFGIDKFEPNVYSFYICQKLAFRYQLEILS